MIKKILNILVLYFALNTFVIAEEEHFLSIGNDKATVVVKVFSSLTCPHCASFHKEIFEKLKINYIDTNQVRFEHHSFPLDLAALNAEKVLRSVSDKEKSFKLLGEIYKKQNQWAVGSDINVINESIKKIGLEFGLNASQIDKSLKDEKIQDQILNERINAQKNYKISSTPTIYVNKKKYEGEHDFDTFKKTLNKYLKDEI